MPHLSFAFQNLNNWKRSNWKPKKSHGRRENNWVPAKSTVFFFIYIIFRQTEGLGHVGTEPHPTHPKGKCFSFHSYLTPRYVVQRTDRFIQWANRYPADKRYWLEYICCTVGVQPRPGLQTDITGRLFWPDSYRDSQHMSCRESTQPCPESCSWRHHRSTKKKKKPNLFTCSMIQVNTVTIWNLRRVLYHHFRDLNVTDNLIPVP